MTIPSHSRRRGLFIVVEGPDASGKTTLARRLMAHYRHIGCAVCAVREPGGTRVSERIRRILLDPKAAINARSELFLYLAARAQLVDEVIRPAKNLGAIVIADRFSLSTLAYQSGGRRLPLKTVRAADDLARDGLRPDLTIVLGVTAAQQRARRHPSRRRDRIERETAPFFARVRRAYARFGKGGTRQLVIDSGIGANAVYNEALAAIDRLNKRARRR